jgi:hypothetical protein
MTAELGDDPAAALVHPDHPHPAPPVEQRAA